MSNWNDIIAIQQRNALWAAANAQSSLANETYRTNQILSESERKKNLELKRQFDEQQEIERNKNLELKRQFDEQQNLSKKIRFAKGLLVKTELMMEGRDFLPMSSDELYSLKSNISSMVSFSESNNILIDLFDNIEDIRFAHKVMNEIPEFLEKLNISLEEKLREEEKNRLDIENQAHIDSLSAMKNYFENMQNNGPGEEYKVYLSSFFGEAAALIIIYSRELYLAYCFEENAKMLLQNNFNEESDIKKAYQESLQFTTSHIQYVSQFLSEDTIKEIKLLHFSIFDFIKIYDQEKCFTYLEDFHKEFDVPNLCPVCESEINIICISRSIPFYFAGCSQYNYDINEIEKELRQRLDSNLFSVGLKSHYYHFTRNPEYCEYLIEKNNIRRVDIVANECDIEEQKILDEINRRVGIAATVDIEEQKKVDEINRLLNEVGLWKRIKLKKQMRQLLNDIQHRKNNEELKMNLLEVDKLLMNKASKRLRKKLKEQHRYFKKESMILREKRKKKFEKYMADNEDEFVTVFGILYDDPNTVKAKILERLEKYSNIAAGSPFVSTLTPINDNGLWSNIKEFRNG